MKIEDILHPNYIENCGIPDVLILNSHGRTITHIFTDGKSIEKRCRKAIFTHEGGSKAELTCETPAHVGTDVTA